MLQLSHVKKLARAFGEILEKSKRKNTFSLGH